MAAAAQPSSSATRRAGVRAPGIVVGTAALALGLWAVPVAPGDGVAAVASGDAAHEDQEAAPAPARAVEARAAPAPSGDAAPPLIAAFEAAADLRVFADAALRRPADGGVFYALRALAECRRWREAPPEPPMDVVVERSHRELSQRRAWADLANRRCAGFVDDELADAEVERVLALGMAQRDPLVLAYRGWLDAVAEADMEAVVAALAQVLQTADPALLEWVALTGADYIEAGAGALAPLDETTRRRRRDAWALLPCEVGADCARPDLGAASRCLASGLCTEGRREAIVLRGAWRSAAERAALAEEVALLRRALQAQDARAALGLAAPRGQGLPPAPAGAG